MLDKFILTIGEYITQYIKSTTIYKSLLVFITVSWFLFPLFGIAPVVAILSISVIVWLVTEYLYTKRLEDEGDI